MACKQVLGWFTVAGVCAWLTIVGEQSSHGGTITIDTFDLPDKGTVFILSRDDDGDQWDRIHSVSDGSILGGEREVMIDISGALDLGSVVAVGVIGVDLNVDDGNGMFTFGSQTNSGSVARLTYDGQSDEGLGSLDLTDGGINTDFVLRFAACDGVVGDGLDIAITAESSLGGTLSYWGDIPDHGNPSDSLVHLIPFAEFTATGGDASFDTIEALTFEFNGDRTPNVDFSLDFVAAVPEPSSVAMLGLCLVVFVGRVLRRRRR